MSFSADWLSLREPFDRAARAVEPKARFRQWLATQRHGTIIDLGGGTGSTVRAIDPDARLAWLVVERDQALIAEGRRLMPALDYLEADLQQNLDTLLPDECMAITASALIDLVSLRWLEGLVELCSKRRLPLYIALTYDGRQRWRPGDIFDAEAKRLFNRHQCGDKGFGPALGPKACDALRDLLDNRNGEIVEGESSWKIEPHDRAIQSALLEGYRTAAFEIAEPAQMGEIEAWSEARQTRIDKGVSRHSVGHRDFLWIPP